MARIRTIKPEFWTDSKTGTLSGLATKLFLGMLNHSDDFGVCPFDIFELKARILPYEQGLAVDLITPLLVNELLPRRLILLVEHSSNARRRLALWIPNFTKHQKVDKPGSPLFPGWDRDTTPDSYDGEIRVVEQLSEAEELIRETFVECSGNVRAGKERKVEDRKVEEKPWSGSNPTGVLLAKSQQDSLNGKIRAVFNYWQTRCGHLGAHLDDKRSRLIKTQLNSGKSVEDIKLAIDGVSIDPFSQGLNDRGRKYDDISLICRDAEHVERFMEIAKGPKNGGLNGSRNGQHHQDSRRTGTSRTTAIGGARGGAVSKPTPAVGPEAGVSPLREPAVASD